jgi:hypothetical protein
VSAAATGEPPFNGVTPVEVARGLVRWVTPHPEWNPNAAAGSASEWPQIVGSVLYELPDVAVLIDPLMPRGGREGELAEHFVRWLDARVRGRAVTILTTIRFHRRDRGLLAARYRASTTQAWNWIPPGVTRFRLRGARETLYWLPAVSTLVVGDSLIGGDAGGVQLCPPSWLADTSIDRAGLASRMRPLLELPIERLLVSHGEPVLGGGRAALASAIEEASA